VIGPAGLAWFLRGHPGWQGKVQEAMRRLAEQGAALSAADYAEALDQVTRLRADLAAVFARLDVILTPCIAALPWPADATHRRASTGSQSAREATPYSPLSRMPAGWRGSASQPGRQAAVYQSRCSSSPTSARTSCS
jgi:Asp-tRNA(Asn)/Glu-tRNA(Gln) amidotransferase A subunit family amidase